MAFTDEQIEKIWKKGTVVSGYESSKYRKDCCGAWMRRNKYGEQTNYGWQIDHAYPSSKGGKDDVVNLRPMQWENNQSKADDYPKYTYAVTSKEDKNIDKEGNAEVGDGLQKILKKLYNI